MSDSVGTKLLDEIERVSAKRERWLGYERDAGPRVMFGPALAMMKAAIDAGKAAAASGDAVASIRALKDLQEFNNDD